MFHLRRTHRMQAGHREPAAWCLPVVVFCVMSFAGLAALPAAAQSAGDCGTSFDCVNYRTYPSYYVYAADHCPADDIVPPAIPANIRRWYSGTSNGFDSEGAAAQAGHDMELCAIEQIFKQIVCQDLGFTTQGNWIATLYWQRNPDVIATARRGYSFNRYGPGKGQGCSPIPLIGVYYEVHRHDGYGCPDGDWRPRVDADGNRFCYRPRTLPCAGKAPSSWFGNPIDCVPGTKRETAVDYRGAGVNPLEFVREYDSQRLAPAFPGNHAATPLGSGWRTKYDRRIDTGTFNGMTTIVLTREDGGLRYFKLNGGAITATAEEQGRLQRNGVAWRYTSVNDMVEDYDATGRLTSVADRAGATLSLAYDAQGRLTSVSDGFGRQLNLTYDAAGHIRTMITPGGGTYSYDYDAYNNLTAVTYPDLRVRRYVYNEAGLTSGAALFNSLTGIIDENGVRFASFAYDATGRATETMHHATASEVVEHYSVAYDSTARRTVIDPLGTARTYSLETAGGLSRVTGASAACSTCRGGLISAVTYDANSNVSSGLDFNDKRVCYTYDLTRNLETARVEGLLSTEYCAAVVASPPIRPDVRKTSTTWHPVFRLPATITEPAAGGTRTTTFTYDGSGNLTQKSIAAPKNDGSGSMTSRTWSWTYTTLGRVLTSTDPNGRITTYAYYADTEPDLGKRGNVAAITNPLGHVTQITAYDADGRPLTVVDPNGLSATLGYDLRGRITSRIVGSETTRYIYDGVGQLTQATLPDQSYVAYTYDGAHRLMQIRDGLGNRITYALDAMGNRIGEQVFDSSGFLSRTRSRNFDALGRLATDLGALNQSTAYAYDGNGNLLTATDPLAHATTNYYDALNRLTQVKDADQGVTVYAYDAAGNLTQATDPNGLATTYTYDGLGNLIQQSSPDTRVTTSTYDAAGNLQTRLHARGITATYTSDALRRVTRVVYTKPGVPTLTHTFEYDGSPAGAANAKGRLTRVTDAAATTTWTYNGQGRVATKTQTIGTLVHTVRYDYNGAGQLAQLTTPSGQRIAYTYSNNRISGISGNGAVILGGAYTTPFGPVGAWQWGNGASTFRTFDRDGRLASWEFTANGVSLIKNVLAYDTAGRIIAIADGNRNAINQSYPDYDAVDRLLRAETGGPATRVRQYTYDPNGNRQTAVVDGATTTYAYSSGTNRLSALSGATVRSYAYNAIGEANSVGPFTPVYDPADRMAQVLSGGAIFATYDVNALGQRVRKTVGGTVTHFVYDEQGRLLGEYDGAGTIIQETVWLDELPVAILRPVVGQTPLVINTFYVHADHLGSPRAVTNRGKNGLRWTWDNVDPFGGNAANPSPTGDLEFNYPLRFPGQYYDAETGLHYNNFRDYDPAIGRYVQSDPIGLKGGVNTYAYVLNSPISNRDVLGLATCGSGFNEGLVPDNPFGHPFSYCCKRHDDCYDNCFSMPPKSECDENFCKCMVDRCNGLHICRVAAQTYCDAVKARGQGAFDSARKNCGGGCRN